EFLDTRNRWLETERAECQIIGADPVDMERGGFLAIAGRVDGDGAYSSNGCGGKPRLRGRNRAWCQQREVGEVPTVERNLLHRVRGQYVAHAARHTIDERHVRPDDNRFGRVADVQTKIANERAAHFEGQRGDHLRLETERGRRDGIGSCGYLLEMIP